MEEIFSILALVALTGLLRAASFLGLGLSLVALGWLYQRFVFPARATDSGTGKVSTD